MITQQHSPTDDATSSLLAREVYGGRYKAIQKYVDILTPKGVEWGLLGPREPERIWGRHVLNCAALDSLLPEGADVVDIGSGAGLPGLAVAILRPDLHVTLVEPLERRTKFLSLAVEELSLGDQVAVVRGRAEEQKFTADIVTCRAVASLDKLLKWTAPLFLPDGALVALKGDRAHSDVAEAQRELVRRGLDAQVMSIRAHQRAEPTAAVVVKRDSR